MPALDPDRAAALERFLELLLRWNTRINLVAERDPEAIRQRHLADSLQLLPLLPAGDGPLGDLGSGGGFPGLVLAIASGRPTHLVESDRRKSAFLTEAAGRLSLTRLHVHPQRIEDATLPPLAALTARALAPLATLLPHAARFLAPGGLAIFPKGRNAEAELTAALPHWHLRSERFASRTDPEATIFRLSDIRRAGPDA
ncbi:MAG TPA: 16S rRNA (guanine(527)-N(7))-methyltransferase RsmG [Falsiroseomonas sp.]|jgi:16S rRNA (guanine527-N7)-methyltransferase|nr:16S rRNA (guanine(527)-N(7))-methyltransferase RsmG [Falsiroseomonas sp.]